MDILVFAYSFGSSLLWVGLVLVTKQHRGPSEHSFLFFVVACVGVWFVLAWLRKPDISLGQKKLDTAATSFYLELFVHVLLSVDDDPCFISLFL